LSQRWTWITATIAAVLITGAAFGLRLKSNNEVGARDSSAPTFIGSETCASCHQAEAKLWNASQHKAAMAHASDKTVLGDFNEASFDYYGVHSRFFR
jgi:hypothetical protein